MHFTYSSITMFRTKLFYFLFYYSFFVNVLSIEFSLQRKSAFSITYLCLHEMWNNKDTKVISIWNTSLLKHFFFIFDNCFFFCSIVLFTYANVCCIFVLLIYLSRTAFCLFFCNKICLLNSEQTNKELGRRKNIITLKNMMVLVAIDIVIVIMKFMTWTLPLLYTFDICNIFIDSVLVNNRFSLFFSKDRLQVIFLRTFLALLLSSPTYRRKAYWRDIIWILFFNRHASFSPCLRICRMTMKKHNSKRNEKRIVRTVFVCCLS